MRKFLLPIGLFLFIAGSCSEENVSPKSGRENSKKPPKTISDPAPVGDVSGLTMFKVTDLAIPSEGLPDAKRFYTNGILRASTAYNPYGITSISKNGTPRIRYYVNPTEKSEYLLGAEYPYHYRAEFTRYPWRISHPLGTEEWLGFSYIFPTEAEGYTQPSTPVSIYQNHAGSVEGQTSNPPALQLELAYPGQLKSTPLGGEIMICNQILGYRYVAQGVRATPGGRLDIVIQIIYGLENEGLFNVWINGKLQTFPGSTTLPSGNAGTTVWPSNPVGGNSKLGLYHHQLRYKNLVTANAENGHTHMEMFMTDWNDVLRSPSDWDYKNNNAYDAVDTSGYQ